ncbi:MAG TPA: LysR family transcriptional regulator, partial [Telluria sp.]|nr:LysR family transcriptional regulator [Telluria sp.]
MDRPMEWSDVKIFLAVARSGSLGAAGRELGLAQPTVGRRLSALEDAVGTLLFQRTHQGLLLTDAGQSVLATAERMEEEALHFERMLEGGEGDLTGLLRVTASDWFGSLVLAPALSAFGRRHPGIAIELLTDSRPYDLARREADLAFRITPFTEQDIVVRRFRRLDYGLFGPKGTPPPAERGAGARLITMNTAFAAMPDVEWLARMLPDARVVFRSNNREAQARACADGLGLAVLPLALARHFPQLERIDLAEPPPARDT